jgi:Tol biopolymer transport system component
LHVVDDDLLDRTTAGTNQTAGGPALALSLLLENRAVQVPFPKDFDSVLGYEFDLSPDGQQVAIAFGTRSCDYPGDLAAVYLFSLRDDTLTRISPEHRLAGRPKFSPDGRMLAYTDFQGTGTTAIYMYDLATKQGRKLTRPRSDHSDYVIDWR